MMKGRNPRKEERKEARKETKELKMKERKE